ncbi:MAG: hypothetical protein CUN55_20260, partial [Phototrophicales bacterium]
MLLNRPFKGLEQRKANILKNVENSLWDAIYEVKGPLDATLSKWLQGHAITNPSEWAEARVGDDYDEMAGISPEDAMQVAIDEYMRYSNNNQNTIYDPRMARMASESTWANIMNNYVIPN